MVVIFLLFSRISSIRSLYVMVESSFSMATSSKIDRAAFLTFSSPSYSGSSKNTSELIFFLKVDSGLSSTSTLLVATSLMPLSVTVSMRKIVSNPFLLLSLTMSPYLESFLVRYKSYNKTEPVFFSCLRNRSESRRSPYIAEKE